MSRDTLERILNLAAQAPSGDNSQPWSFAFNEASEVLSVHATFDADHAVLNVHNAGTYIALGALLRNLQYAAALEDLTVDIRRFPVPDDPALVAHVTFATASTPTPDIDAQTIKDRSTNRKPYQKTTLDASTLGQLQPSGASSNISHFVTDKDRITAYGRMAATMEQVALSTRRLHQIFFGSIFWRSTDNQAGKSGLYIETMELPPPVKVLFKALRHWSVMRVLGFLGFPRLVSSTNADVYASCGAIGLIYTEGKNTPAEYLAVGEDFQETWLQSTKHGLGFQPIAGILYLLRYIELQPDDTMLSPENKQMLTELKQEFLDHSPNATLPAMMYRIGYADKPTSVSYRRPVVVHYT